VGVFDFKIALDTQKLIDKTITKWQNEVKSISKVFYIILKSLKKYK